MTELAKILAREAVRPKAIFGAHKWFARRLGSAFRALLVATEASTIEEFWRHFYRTNIPTNKTVLDPFVGGGTSVLEAQRLGYHTVGVDIDPAAVAITSFETRLAQLPDTTQFLEEVKTRMRRVIGPFYGILDGWKGNIPLHFFWVQEVECLRCGNKADAHPSHQLAIEAAQKEQWVIDPATDEVLRLDVKRKKLPSGLPIAVGTVKKGAYCCPTCGWTCPLIDYAEQRNSPPKFRLFAVETVTDPKDGRATPTKERQLRAATPEDLAAYRQAEDALSQFVADDPDFVPTEPIWKFQSADDRLTRYQYRLHQDLFNARQKLHLGLLAREIEKIEKQEIREAFAIAFSDHLTTNCLFASYTTKWRRLAPLFSVRAFRHIVRPVEINPWMDGTGRGTFPNAVHAIRRARASLFQSKEPKPDGSNQIVHFAPAQTIRAEVRLSDSRSLSFIGDGQIDIVLSDPPYFDNIAYSDLAQFFHPWMKRLDLIKRKSIPLSKSLGVNGSAEDFQRGLATCFLEVARVLAPEGRFLFTFQHRRAQAWQDLGSALCTAKLAACTVFPILGERSEGLHKKENSSSWDIVFVCRHKREAKGSQGGTQAELLLSESDRLNLERARQIAKATRERRKSVRQRILLAIT